MPNATVDIKFRCPSCGEEFSAPLPIEFRRSVRMRSAERGGVPVPVREADTPERMRGYTVASDADVFLPHDCPGIFEMSVDDVATLVELRLPAGARLTVTESEANFRDKWRSPEWAT